MSLLDSIKYTSLKATESSEKYLNKTKEYYKLTALSYFSSFTSEIVKSLLISVALVLSGIFFSIAGFIALAECFDSYIKASGFIGLLYLIVALVIYFLRARIEDFLVYKISQKIKDHENLQK